MLRRPVVLLVALVTTIALAACGSSSSSSSSKAQVPSAAVAVVAGQPILQADFQHLLSIGLASLRQGGQPVPKPGSAQYDQLRQTALSILYERVIFRLEAKKDGIVVDERQVASQLAQAISQAGGAARWHKQLAVSGATDLDYRQVLEIQQISQKLYTRVTQTAGQVTAAEIARQYTSQKASYLQPESRRVEHVLIGGTGTATPTPAQYAAYLKKALVVLKLARSGADFTKLVTQYSTDSGKTTNHGIYTVTNNGGFDPAFAAAAFALKTGQITPHPVKSAFGYHIIKALTAIQPPSLTPLAHVAAQIRQQLLALKQQAAAKAWLNAVRAAYLKTVAFAPGYSLAPNTLGSSSSSSSGSSSSSASTGG
jgi:parvulin-like peptidyl-prolyl isomerase